MKFKDDFITNSSSTSHIVCIPEDFDKSYYTTFMDEELKYYAAAEMSDEEKLKEHTKNVVKDIDVLRTSRSIICYDDDYLIFIVIRKICDKFDFILGSVDGGPGQGAIISINPSELKSKLDHITSGKWKEKV